MSKVSLGTSDHYGEFKVSGYQLGTGDRQAPIYQVLEGNKVLASGMSKDNAKRIAQALDYWQRMTP